MALGGDATALRLCLERLVPPRKDSPVSLTLPDVKTPADVLNAQSAILKAVGDGDLTPIEASTLSGLVENTRKTIETQDLEQRLTALETTLKQQGTR